MDVELGKATLRAKLEELVPLLVITEALFEVLISLNCEEVPTRITSSIDLLDTIVLKFDSSNPSMDTTSLVLIENRKKL